MQRAVSWGTRAIYEHGIKPVLFRMDPEQVHDRAIAIGSRIARHRMVCRMLHAAYAASDPILEQTVHGIRFPNPIGLAAGFDKNGRIIEAVEALGFGFVEIGSVTARACEGNAKPRLWRLPKSHALQVHYGLPNDGADVVADRIRKCRATFPIGVSVAKTNARTTVTPESGIRDYVAGLRAVDGVGAYSTINISCPNAYGGEPFTDPESLHALLVATDALERTHPTFLKMPCDLTLDALDELIDVILQHNIQGMIFSNLTKDRTNPLLDKHEVKRAGARGGISGAPLRDRVLPLIAHAAQRSYGRLTIIGCGGVASADDAYEQMRHGASLVQLVTGMIYHGPSLIGQIVDGLAQRCRRDGFATIADVVGSGLSK